MDNNKQSLPPADAGGQQPPVNPVPSPAPQDTQPVQPAGNNRTFLLMLLVLIIILVIGGGVFWYISNMQKGSSTTSATATPRPSPTQNVDSLEKDLNSTSLEDLDKEFATVDADLKGL